MFVLIWDNVSSYFLICCAAGIDVWGLPGKTADTDLSIPSLCTERPCSILRRFLNSLLVCDREPRERGLVYHVAKETCSPVIAVTDKLMVVLHPWPVWVI